MILVDTSAWVEFLRDTGSPACVAVDDLLGSELAICDPVTMEVLAGARDDHHLARLRGLLARAEVIATEPGDFEAAAALHRRCRRAGETVRRLVDCLIGATAVRAGAEVLHADADFAVLGRHTPVRCYEPS